MPIAHSPDELKTELKASHFEILLLSDIRCQVQKICIKKHPELAMQATALNLTELKNPSVIADKKLQEIVQHLKERGHVQELLAHAHEEAPEAGDVIFSSIPEAGGEYPQDRGK